MPSRSQHSSLSAIVALICGVAMFTPGNVSAQQPGIITAPAMTAEQLFDHLRVIRIDITVPQPDWDVIRMQGRLFTEALTKELSASPFTYVRGDISIDGLLIKDVGIRKKGFLGSLNDQRPSLKIKFDEYIEQAPITGVDRLTLNNNNQDPARLSQYLGYRFFNSSGTVAPRCNLAHVTVNGQSLGIYSNVESIRKPMLAHRFGNGNGGLYEGTVTDFYSDFINKFELKNKHAEVRHVQQVADLLSEADLNVQTLGQLLDIEAFVRFWATESLLGFWDGYTNNQNNYFVYRNPANDKLYFIPWGADALFTDTIPLPPYMIRPRFVFSQALLANRLYRIPEFAQLYHATLDELMTEHWNEQNMFADIDRVKSQIKSIVLPENTGFEYSVAAVRDFIKDRRTTLNEEMANGPVTLSAPARRPVYFKQIGTMTASFNTKWYDKTPPSPIDLGDVSIEMDLDGERVVFESIGVYAEYSTWPPTPPGAPRPPAIVFAGVRSSDGAQMTLGLGLSTENFRPTSGEPVDISGFIMGGTQTQDWRMLGGTVIFDEAAMTDGATVRGELKLKAVQLVSTPQ